MIVWIQALEAVTQTVSRCVGHLCLQRRHPSRLFFGLLVNRIQQRVNRAGPGWPLPTGRPSSEVTASTSLGVT
jgi:hypothetical protein